MKRIALAALAAMFLMIGGALAWYLWPSGMPGDKAAIAYAPLFSQIEPPDGAVVRSGEAWVRWSVSGPAKGRVLWRKVGESTFRRVDATDQGVQLLARPPSRTVGTNTS